MKHIKSLYLSILFTAIFMPTNIICAGTAPESNPANYHEYVPMIREDRVWEYYHHRMMGNLPTYAVWRMKFDGTEERFGKTYHKLVPIGGEEYYDESDYIRGLYYRIVEDSYPTETALMREEDGKVYVINEMYGKTIDDYYFSMDNTPDTESQEFLIYDFTHDKGDIIPIVFSDPPGGPFSFHEDTRVSEIEFITVDGEVCKSVSFDPYLDEYRHLTIFNDHRHVEGVGCTTQGVLYKLNLGYHAAGMDFYIHLNNVYNDKGEVIYAGEGITKEKMKNVGVDGITADGNPISYHDGNICIGIDGMDYSLNVISIDGHSVISLSGTEPAQISVGSLAPGLYIAELACNGKRISSKIRI